MFGAMLSTLGDFTQIPVGPNPVQVCPPLGDGSTVNLYNQDVNNAITVSRNNSVAINASNGVPVQPLTNGVFDASRALYAVAPSGTVPLIVIPQGGTLSPSPAQIAAQIAISGVSLLAKSSPLGSAGNTALAGNTSVNLTTKVPVTQTGYEFSISAQQSSVVATFPLLEIFFVWFDSVTGQNTALDHFYTSAYTNAGGFFLTTIGTGPSKGDQLTIILFCTTNTPITYTWTAAQNSRVYSRDDWRWIGYKGLGFGGGSFAGTSGLPDASETEANVLADYGVPAHLAGTTVTFVIPLYNGDVWFHVDETGVSPSNYVCEIKCLVAGFGTADIFSGQVGGGLNGNPINTKLTLPRAPCILSFTNNGSVNAVTNAKIMISEQAA